MWCNHAGGINGMTKMRRGNGSILWVWKIKDCVSTKDYLRKKCKRMFCNQHHLFCQKFLNFMMQVLVGKTMIKWNASEESGVKGESVTIYRITHTPTAAAVNQSLPQPTMGGLASFWATSIDIDLMPGLKSLTTEIKGGKFTNVYAGMIEAKKIPKLTYCRRHGPCIRP